MLRDKASEYYFSNHNCAESVFLAADEVYGLGIGEDHSRVVGGFGGGIQTGSACGAFLAGVGVLSLLCIDGVAHDSPNLRTAVKRLSDSLEERLGSTMCREIRPRAFDETRRCAAAVYAVCDILDEITADMGLLEGRDS